MTLALMHLLIHALAHRCVPGFHCELNLAWLVSPSEPCSGAQLHTS
jgi:hypothetical protein